MTLEPFKMPNTQSEQSQVGFGKTLLTYWPVILPVCFGFLALGSINSKLDTILETQKEQKTQYASIVDRQNTITLQLTQLEGRLNIIGAETSRNSTSIVDMNGRVTAIGDKIRWTPK